MTPARHDKKPKRVPTREDKLQALMTRDAADALIGAIKPLLAEQPHRLVRTLGRHEVEAMAIACVSAYVQARELLETMERELGVAEPDWTI